MAKEHKRVDKGPKKVADDAARQARKLAGPKYLRGAATLVAGDLRPGRGRGK